MEAKPMRRRTFIAPSAGAAIGLAAEGVGARKLRFDAEAEALKTDAGANALLRRTYRKPWVVPEKV
jgi:hypothetical protein